MNHKTSALKNIFSKFFFKYWDQIKFHFNEQRQNDIINNVLAFLNCGNPKFGFSAFVCPKSWDKLLFLLLANLNSALLVELFMLKNGHRVCMLSFLMLNIFISLFLFLLDLLEISSLNITLNFAP